MVADNASSETAAKSRGFAADDASSLNDVGKNIGSAYAAAMAYLSAQADRARVAVRNLLLLTVLAILAGVIVGSVVISAAVLLVVGVAEGIATLLGGRAWAGDLITGAGVVAVVMLSGYLMVSKMAKAARLQTIAGYQNPNFKRVTDPGNCPMAEIVEPSVESVLSESDFLKLQAEKAKAEITDSLHRATAALASNTDPREVTRRHPWIALVSAAVVGFFAAVAAIPSKQEQELRRLERIRQAMNPEPPAPSPASDNGNAKKAAPKQSLGATLLHELIQLLKPILITAITASIKAGANPPPPAPASPAAAPPGSDPGATDPM